MVHNTTSSLDKLLTRAVLLRAPHVLGQLCRSRAMPTFGCFDRDYWNYSTCDTPNARKQEAALFLVLLHDFKHPDNPYAHKPILLEWAEFALHYWARMQLSSGAFNDLYVSEHSYVATAFSTYAVAATAKHLEGRISFRPGLTQALAKACDWLAAEPPSPVTNQVCGAAAALAQAGETLGESRWRKDARRLVENVAHRQSREGWLPEYGGPDVGYLSVAVDYLGKYHALTQDTQALDIALPACRFLESLLFPDGSFGGEFGSRSTAYLLPDGLAVFSPLDTSAASLLRALELSLQGDRSVLLPQLDDKYLLFNGYTYLQAMTRQGRRTGVLDVPTGATHHPESGLARIRRNGFCIVLNTRKGGASRILFEETGTSLHDSGLLLESGTQKFVSSLLGSSKETNSPSEGIRTQGQLQHPFDNRMSALKHFVLVLVAMSTGWNGPLRRAFKKFLRSLIISGSVRQGHDFCRTILISNGVLTIEDTFDAPASGTAFLTGSLESIYGESSRYFEQAELEYAPLRAKVPSAGRHVCIRKYDARGTLLSMELQQKASPNERT